jgi:hypothetical protein
MALPRQGKNRFDCVRGERRQLGRAGMPDSKVNEGIAVKVVDKPIQISYL